MVTPAERSTRGRTTLSIELFPPKDSEGEVRLWRAVDELKVIAPDFVSVTYGAGGSTRDRTIRIAEEFTSRTGVSTVAHLTCVGSTRDELVEILRHYKRSGIASILALRGDPTGGPRAPWVTTHGGLNHADELVELAKQEGGFEIGVAAFPDGHPASQGNFNQDIDTLIRKEDLGASFAVTQFFFSISSYDRMVEALEHRGSTMQIVAGILPVTNVKQLTKMAELSGTPIPQEMFQRFEEIESDPEAVRNVGIEIATNLSQELLNRGVAGLHYYAMNSSVATLQIVKNLGLDSHEPR